MESTLSRQRTQCNPQFYGQLKSNGIRDYLPFQIDGSAQYYFRSPHMREIQPKTDIQYALDYLHKTADESYRDSPEEMPFS